MIERWTDPKESTDHIWSLWRDGHRIGMGDRHSSAEAAESEAIAYCQESLGRQPDRVVRL